MNHRDVYVCLGRQAIGRLSTSVPCGARDFATVVFEAKDSDYLVAAVWSTLYPELLQALGELGVDGRVLFLDILVTSCLRFLSQRALSRILACANAYRVHTWQICCEMLNTDTFLTVVFHVLSSIACVHLSRREMVQGYILLSHSYVKVYSEARALSALTKCFCHELQIAPRISPLRLVCLSADATLAIPPAMRDSQQLASCPGIRRLLRLHLIWPRHPIARPALQR